MTKPTGRPSVDLSESSVHGDAQAELESDDVATQERLDRLRRSRAAPTKIHLR